LRYFFSLGVIGNLRIIESPRITENLIITEILGIKNLRIESLGIIG